MFSSVSVSNHFISVFYKKQKKKYWISLILLELFSIVASYILLIYYGSLSKHGFLPYLGEILLSFGAGILYFIMLFITTCTKIIMFEKH